MEMKPPMENDKTIYTHAGLSLGLIILAVLCGFLKGVLVGSVALKILTWVNLALYILMMNLHNSNWSACRYLSSEEACKKSQNRIMLITFFSVWMMVVGPKFTEKWVLHLRPNCLAIIGGGLGMAVFFIALMYVWTKYFPMKPKGAL